MSETKDWKPEDFGFNPWKIAPGVYFKDSWELRSMPNDMWLLRRKELKGGATRILVKFYYEIQPRDTQFAEWLLSKRLYNDRKNDKADKNIRTGGAVLQTVSGADERDSEVK